jgi:hypothetical protein
MKHTFQNKNAKVQTGVDPNLIISYKCSLCSQKVFKRPSFIQTALAILIHVFYDHRSNKALRDAALQDILSFQQASGIEIYMEKAPDYRPLIA